MPTLTVILWGLILLGASVRSQQRTCTTTFDVAQELLLNTNVGQLTLQNNITTATPSGTCSRWRITPQQLLNADLGCQGPERFLLLELYRLVQRNSRGPWVVDSEAALSDLYFMAARDQAPQIVVDNFGGQTASPALRTGSFSASVGAADPGGNGGTFMDFYGAFYMRPHQRLLIPNITVSVNNQVPTWYITVANLALPAFGTSSTGLQGYSIRATCVAAPEVPCPRPLPTAGPCSTTNSANTTGICTQTDPGDVSSLVCKCAPGFGDYGCNKQVLPLTTSGSTAIATVPAGGWVWAKVQVPLPPSPQSPANQVLLVDFVRSPNSGAGADPLLFVKPVNSVDRNLPYYDDANLYGDLHSYYLQQSYHYQVIRDFGTGASTRDEFYIGIFNNFGRFNAGQLMGQLRVRWGTPAQPFMCPADCNGRGSCTDPKTLSVSWLSPTNWPLGTGDPSAGFICNCTAPYGGLTCEAPVIQVSVSTSGQTVKGNLGPGEWAYLQLNMDSRKFNYRTDDLNINWQATDSLGVSGTGMYNAFLTFDEDQYPRQANHDSAQPYKKGYQLFYSKVAIENKQLLQFQGSSLRPGSTYIVGMYNSEYARQSTYAYQTDVSIPSPQASWLHPYMSVVLGVTAAIVLCLVLTLCKRMVVRNGWGPWGRRGMQDDMMAGGSGNSGMPRHAMLQIMPRQQGVPQNIIATFPTYEYTPPPLTDADVYAKAAAAGGPDMSPNERTSLARRSQREALQAMAAEAATSAAAAVRGWQQQQREAAAEPQAAPAAAGTPAEVAGGAPVAGDAAAGGVAAQPVLAVQSLGAEEADAMAAAAKVAAAAHHRQAAGGEGGELPPLKTDDDLPACTVCLCEYEAGDAMRRLMPCNHEFHRACIDKWMTQHTTCPICREALVSAQDMALMQEQAGVALIYIPQSVRRPSQPGDNNQDNGGGGAAQAQQGGFFQRMFQRGGPPAGGGGQVAMQPVPSNRGQQQWQQSSAGWHVTMAWGSTHPGGDPFASPCRCTAGGGEGAGGPAGGPARRWLRRSLWRQRG